MSDVTVTTRRTIRDLTTTCRIRVKIRNRIRVVRLIFSNFDPRGGKNRSPIGNRVHLVPLGWINTDEVTFLGFLPWDSKRDFLFDGSFDARPLPRDGRLAAVS